ncbi:MAG TPA: protein kinase [Gemmatimonadales bacterium]|nr:protein kinase [Gemmatimonadales bacterium]
MPDALPALAAALSDRYRLERKLGEGGMATVYLAEDLKHHRRVAIKVLKPELAAVLGGDRFVQEIRTTAQLQHPHILPLFDSGEVRLSHAERSDGPRSFLYYVMPYIEGETLRGKLNREKQLGIEEAIRIATEVADALDYAHRHGVIHRDIKPENILLHDGRPMVADFGIALAVSAAAGGRMTETGLSMGTPHYMSPEQATAESEITGRSDIYSLASVLYEMLTGNPPHVGNSAQQVIAKIVTQEPAPVTRSRKSVPANVAAAVTKALEKLPADRFETARAFADALADPHFTAIHGTAAAAASRGAPSWLRDPRTVTLSAVAALSLGIMGWALAHRGDANGPEIYDVALPDSAAMDFAGYTPSTPYGSPLRGLALSPDGRVAVYVAKQGNSTILWRRSLRDTTATPIQGSEGASAPVISPDGLRLAFVAHTSLMTAPIAGGPPRAIADLDGDPFTLAWITPTTLMLVDGAGYRFRRIDTDGGTIDTHPVPWCFDGSWIPGEQRLLCNARGVGSVVDPISGKVWLLRNRTASGLPATPLAGWAFRLLDERYLVYQSPQGDLRAAPYDPSTHSVGRSASLLNGVRSAGVASTDYDLTPTGTLLYAPGGNGHVGRLVDLSAGGTSMPLPVPADAYERWDVSRDGHWLAAVAEGAGYFELRIANLRGGQSFTWLRSAYVDQPLWGPDDSTLLVQVRDSTGAAILRGSPSSAATPDTVYASHDPDMVPALLDWWSSHQALGGIGAPRQIVRIDPYARPARFDTISGGRTYTMVSPDGRHIVFSLPAGSRVVVSANPPGSWERQVGASAVEPVWLSSSEILYRSGFTWYLVRIDPATGEPAGAASVWGSDPRFSDTFGWSNRPDWHGGIIYLQGPADTRATYLRVIPHWVAHMERVVDEANR